jgi:hypothetical protein
MNLSFLSPVYLLGLLGIAVPILAHLLTRRHPTRIRFSAVYLLTQSQNRFIKTAQPNQLLLLLARCLAVAFLSLALAGPLFTLGQAAGFLSAGDSANVFILDDSYSMGATGANSKTVFREAAEYLASRALSGGDEFSLVTASTPARTLHGWTTDRDTLANLAQISNVSWRTTQIGKAVDEAFKLLESSQKARKRIFLLTDLEKNGWNKDDFPPMPKNTGIHSVHVVDFSGSRAQANRAAITSIEASREFLSGNRVMRVKATVANLLDKQPLHKLSATLWVDGKRISETTLDVPAGGSATKKFTFPHNGEGPAFGYVEIQEDGLSADNRRYFSYQPDRKIRVLVVDGDPKTVGHQSESFYLERALNPLSSASAEIEPTVSTSAELPRRELSHFSIILLCNVRDLPYQYELELEKFVTGGGGLFVSLGDQVDPKFYNEKLGNLLPARITSLNQVPPEAEPFRFLVEPSRHPVLEVFSGKTLNEMKTIRFNTIYSVEPAEGKPATVPMRFSNKYPALIESTMGQGKVILFTSTLDRDWNNFPIQPTFLPWVQRWVKYAAHGLETIATQNILAGEKFSLEYDGSAVVVKSPGGKILTSKRDPQSQRFTTSEIQQPGVYLPFGIRTASPAGKNEVNDALAAVPPGAEPLGAFTVNPDTRESKPERISPEEIRNLFQGLPVEFTADPSALLAESQQTTFQLNTPLLLLVFCMLFLEGYLVRRT